MKFTFTNIRNRNKSEPLASFSFCFGRRVLINDIFSDNVHTNVYCVYTAMLCTHKILKFTHNKAKTFDSLLELPFLVSMVCSLFPASLYMTQGTR